MEKTCVVCHDRPASFRCIHCHKPVCDGCSFKDAQGAFCSRNCAANYRSFKAAKEEEKAPGGVLRSLLRKILLLIVLAILLAALYVYGASRGWFGETEKERLKKGEQKLQESLRRGGEGLEEFKEGAQEEMGE